MIFQQGRTFVCFEVSGGAGKGRAHLVLHTHAGATRCHNVLIFVRSSPAFTGW